MSSSITRFSLVCAGALFFASVAFGEGDFQRTKDGRTMVWNSDPKPGDQATWFGDRDSEGYATGAGTLTWYTERGTIYGRYFGNMVKGKFDGPVNVHSKGRTAHALFADGKRTSRWTNGPAPSRIAPEEQASAAQPLIASKPPTPPAAEKTKPAQAIATTDEVKRSEPSANATATHTDMQTPESPAEGPASGDAEKIQKQPATTIASAPQSAKKPKQNPKAQHSAANDKPKTGIDSSLEQLVGPPTSLHTEPATDAAPAIEKLETPEGPRTELTSQEAINLADTEASAQGYDLNEYQRPKADYSSVRDKWSVFYDSKPTDGIPQVGKHFLVTIEDKTKKASIESLR